MTPAWKSLVVKDMGTAASVRKDCFSLRRLCKKLDEAAGVMGGTPTIGQLNSLYQSDTVQKVLPNAQTSTG
jgi:hypothetical protein